MHVCEIGKAKYHRFHAGGGVRSRKVADGEVVPVKVMVLNNVTSVAVRQFEHMSAAAAIKAQFARLQHFNLFSFPD